MVDPELSALEKISEALGSLEDPEARRRVLSWATAKFAPQADSSSSRLGVAVAPVLVAQQSLNGVSHGVGDLADIVELTADGILRVVARDLKAKSRNDAAIRLAHIAIYAHQKMTGEQQTSARKILLPILREWRAYDPNTRVVLARHPGLKRNGDWLSLDVHSRREAENYIKEILDDTTQGAWRPTSRIRKRLDPNNKPGIGDSA